MVSAARNICAAFRMTSGLPRTVYGLVPWSSRAALPNDSFVILLGNNLTWLHSELMSCKTSGWELLHLVSSASYKQMR